MSDFDYSQFEETPPPPRGQSNRTFVLIAGILGAVILIAVVAMAAFALLVLPGRNAQKAEAAAKMNAMNTATVMAATSSAMTAMAPTATPLPTETPTPEPTFTPMPTDVPPTATEELAVGGGMTEDMAMTATVSALLTQAAGGKADAVTDGAVLDPDVEATALPTAGFADGMGIPSLVGLGVLFIGLILITRQLRSARSH
jgi:hypothetical protein